MGYRTCTVRLVREIGVNQNPFQVITFSFPGDSARDSDSESAPRSESAACVSPAVAVTVIVTVT